MSKPYIKKIASYTTVGSLGIIVASSLQGCDTGPIDNPVANNNNNQTAAISDAANAEQGFFLVLQQTGENPNTYDLKEKYPSSEGTRAIVKGMDGSERVLSEAELKKIAEEEAKRFEEGQSQLAQPAAAGNQGLSLGETILASAAGALIGGMIANKLMNNSNYKNHQQSQNSKAGYTASGSRNAGTSNNRSSNSRSQPKSGFFGGGNSRSSRSGGSSLGG